MGSGRDVVCTVLQTCSQGEITAATTVTINTAAFIYVWKSNSYTVIIYTYIKTILYIDCILYTVYNLSSATNPVTNVLPPHLCSSYLRLYAQNIRALFNIMQSEKKKKGYSLRGLFHHTADSATDNKAALLFCS